MPGSNGRAIKRGYCALPAGVRDRSCADSCCDHQRQRRQGLLWELTATQTPVAACGMLSPAQHGLKGLWQEAALDNQPLRAVQAAAGTQLRKQELLQATREGGPKAGSADGK